MIRITRAELRKYQKSVKTKSAAIDAKTDACAKDIRSIAEGDAPIVNNFEQI